MESGLPRKTCSHSTFCGWKQKDGYSVNAFIITGQLCFSPVDRRELGPGLQLLEEAAVVPAGHWPPQQHADHKV